MPVLQKLSFCAAICGILTPERIAFASPFAAFCAVMPAAVVWRCRLAALPAVSVAAFHAKSFVYDVHMMFHVCQSSALPDAPFQCRRGRVTWGQNTAKYSEDGVFRFWVHLSVNNIPCRMQEYNNFVASEKGMLRSALNRVTPCRGISLKRQQEQLLNKKTM